MIIAVNTKATCKDELNEKDSFIFETFSRIIKRHPEHTFVLITEKKQKDLFSDLNNVINVATGPFKKNTTQWYIWYNIKIPGILKKYKVDILVSYGTISSLRTKVPQCIIVPGLAFIHQPSSFKKSQLLFYKTFVPRSLKKAKAIITFSEFSRAEIIKQYKINSDKTAVVYKGVSQKFRQITNEERENVKAKYADGNEYFIYAGIISQRKNLKNLLKAFSAFKKRQRSSMQLIIAGNPGKQFEQFKKSIDSYKFKKDIKLLNGLSQVETVKLIASSYAMVFPSVYEISANSLLKAMKCEVPVITSSTGAMPEICGDAALYFDLENYQDIADKMMLIFKDENLRKELIEKGKVRIKKYDWDNASSLFWNLILKTMN